MARRSQCSSAGDNPLDPNYLPPHYREEYRLAIDALVEEDLEGYYEFLQNTDVVDFLSTPEIQHILGTVQGPQLIGHSEHHFLETVGDGSSDTYWPIHSDQDIPDLDLGWPQLHHFIAPTEVTTLVNPPEPDMPSIKEQARRLIKNAQQVIAIAMDMFTDVDIFADVLNAAMRNVAVYILLDELNAHHFINMVSNCRVNLQAIKFLRVRTVCGNTYQCRSGKSFKGQMMDRFLLTDCRAVLSGNYSFMWSFEKLHRCMAHLFLGQLVTTFDEEFRILYAQSRPLMTENVLPPKENINPLQKRQYPSDRLALYREPRRFLSTDTGQPDEWTMQSCDEQMNEDWRMMPHRKQESLRDHADVYNRFPSQQPHMDPSFDQGRSRIPMMENLSLKRHGYPEGVHGKYSYPFLQPQGMPDSETQGRHFHRGHQPYPGPGPEADYSGYDKFWNQGCLSTDQYPERALPQEMQTPDFDPVLNYLSSTKDFDQSSEKLAPAADLPFSSSHPRRLSLGQPYACQTSPTPSSQFDQKRFLQEPSTDRKDPKVKRGLRNWRISSYLSAYDNPEDEGLPVAPPQAPDPFEEPTNPIQQTALGIDLSFPKIPNVREFKVPAVPRASQIPNYAKTAAREKPKILPVEPPAVAAETKTTPTPSESSSTAEGEKTDEAEQKETKTSILRRGDSFQRKYNAAGINRASRLRHSLIFSSLEQQHTPQDNETTTPDQKDEESDKTESEKTRLSFVSHVFGQRRTTGREPIEWSRYIKSSKPGDENTKTDENNSSQEENSNNVSEKPEKTESVKLPDVEQADLSPSMPRTKPSEAEVVKTDQPVQPPKPLPTGPSFVDMSDPDARLMFFKELAAKRKAAQAAEAEKSKEKAKVKPESDLKINTAVKEGEPVPKESSEDMASKTEDLVEKNATAESAGKSVSEECESASLSLEASEKANKQDSHIKSDSSASQSCQGQIKVSEDLGKTDLENSQSADLPASAEAELPLNKSSEKFMLSNPAEKESNPSHSSTNHTPANIPSPAQNTDEKESPSLESTSQKSLSPSSGDVPSVLESHTLNPESVQLETCISPSVTSGQDTGSEFSSSNPSTQSSSSDPNVLDSNSKKSPISLSSSSPSLSTAEETKSSNITPDYFSLAPAPGISSSNVDKTEVQDSISHSPQESFQSTEETLQKSENMSNQINIGSVPKFASSEVPSAVDSAHVESDIPPEAFTSDSELNSSSLQSTTHCKGYSTATPSTKKSEKDISESVMVVSKSVKGMSKLEKSVSESEKGVSESKRTLSKSEKDVSELEEDISESENTVSESEKTNLESEKDASDSGKTNLESGKNVSESEKINLESEKDASDSEKTNLESGKDVSESEKINLESEKDASDSEKTNLESGKDGSESEKIHVESEKDASDSEKTHLESGKDVSESENNLSETEKGASESEEGVSEMEKGASESKKDVSESQKTEPESDKVASESENTVSESKISPLTEAVAEVLESPEHVEGDIIRSSPSVPESVLPGVSDLESSASETEIKETLAPVSTPTDTPPEHLSSEKSSPVNTDFTLNTSQSETLASPQNAQIQANPPSDPNLTGCDVPSTAQTGSCSSPLSESVGSVLSPEAKKAEGNMSSLHTLGDINSISNQSVSESDKVPLELSAKSPSSTNEPTSEQPVPAENSKTEPELLDTGERKSNTKGTNESSEKESVSSERTNDQVRQSNCSEPAENTSKQSKSSQSRYHSSTANVLSSSNLRDDTKLLLEQISANSQSRNEAAKESPVTDDEKGDKADKNAKKEKEQGSRTLSRVPQKSPEEREKLLERIQSMRKERRVYSRFEMAP